MLDRNARRKDKLEKINNWYNSERYDTLMFLHLTPEFTLQQQLQEAVNKTGVKMKRKEWDETHTNAAT